MNIFFPVYRCHEGNRPRSNVQAYDEEVKEEFARNTRIYAALKPYRDYLYDQYEEKGLSFIRPLFLYTEEKEAYQEQKEFMCGPDVLVSPVLRPKTERKQVHLPPGAWIQMFTEKTFAGGDYEVETPLGLPIAFYRADSEFRDLFQGLEKEIKQ
jgi:alpha-glucosidase